MGMLIDGAWVEDDAKYRQSGGKFVRRDSHFRNWVTSDGSSGFPAKAGRYHLYVAAACPWAHRTILFRKLKGLEDAISLSYVDPVALAGGWAFTSEPDPLFDAKFLHEIYQRADPKYTGRVTVPVLWDKQTGGIVNNESSEIIRMFNSAFDAIGNAAVDYYPETLRAEIDAINAVVYDRVNNGVYKCGFARTQAAYDEAFEALFAALDELEQRLDGQRYLVGDRLTEADWRLFTTLVRFDAVYFGHFKCNLRRIADYPNLSNYLRELYQMPGVADTVDLDDFKTHYYASQLSVNPTGIVARGPEQNLDAPHDRDRFAMAAAE